MLVERWIGDESRRTVLFTLELAGPAHLGHAEGALSSWST